MTSLDQEAQNAAITHGVVKASPILRSMYSNSRTVMALEFRESFLAGAAFGRSQMLKAVLEELRNGKLESIAEIIGMNWQWADWLEKRMKEN